MNPVRMEFVRAKILAGREDDEGWTFANRLDKRGDGGGGWLGGMDVLDVGCGGGLLSEVSSIEGNLIAIVVRILNCSSPQSLARVGGTTLGIDASPDNIAIATTHASQDPFLPFISPSPSSDTSLSYTKPGSLRYRHTSAEQLHAEGRKFDVVCSMEVLEHVDQPGEFLKVLGDMVKVSTM
jgi:polyprenyldihydroxybenzoate methyltransferase/3-demethylubiquinol 3-O-methyltransferase